MSALLDPPKTTLDPIVQETLDWVNEEREARGLDRLDDLLPGYRSISDVCPLAVSLAAGSDIDVGVGSFTVRYDALCKELPRCAIEFVTMFDLKKLPEYLADPEA